MSRGKITTFYSYKGGTGRSMALANVAWLLAANGKRVLVIDWDLEAPGLHRYFLPFLSDPAMASRDGLVDLIGRYVSVVTQPAEDWPPLLSDPLTLATPERFAQTIDFEFPGDGCLHLLGAGRQDGLYGERVRGIDWQAFYERFGGAAFIERLGQSAIESYDHVLIDSRTGLSDTSGICTLQLPSKVVLFFTYNRQSVEGVAAVAAAISHSKPDMHIMPVAMRVVEDAGLASAREFAREHLSRFVRPARLDTEIESYWLDAEVPHYGSYGFEETLATFAEKSGGRNNLLADMEWLASLVVGDQAEQIRLPRMDHEIRERYLRRFRFRDPRVAWLSETLEKDAPQAIRLIQEEASRELEDRDWVKTLCGALRGIGEKLLREGSVGYAEQAVEASIRLSRSIGDESEQVRSNSLLVDLFTARGEISGALSLLRGEVLPLANKLGDEQVFLAANNKAADLLLAVGSSSDALSILSNLVLPRAIKARDNRLQAEVLEKLAHVYEDSDRFQEAYDLRVDLQIPLLRAAGDNRDLAIAIGNLARNRLVSGRLDQASDLAREALMLLESVNDKLWVAHTLGTLASVNFEQGRVEEALSIRQRQLAIYEELADFRGQAQTMGGIAQIFEQQGRYDEALAIRFSRQLPAFERLGDTRGSVSTYSAIAETYQKMGRLDEALKIRLERELPAAEAIGNRQIRNLTMDAIAKLQSAIGRRDNDPKLHRENKIYISYRRSDSGFWPRLIADSLYKHIPRDNVFVDVDSIPLGVDFRRHIESIVSRCDAMLVLIGRNWLEGAAGQRRIDDPQDFIRVEVEQALQRGIAVVPVFVDGARMPPPSILPGRLSELAMRNGIALSRESIDDDVGRLVHGLNLAESR